MIRRLAHRLREWSLRPVLETMGESASVQGPSQVQLKLEYARLLATGQSFPTPREVGFRVYSQADEDGILLFLFSIIGVRKYLCVEVCASDGIECNTANLIRHHGWHGLLIDGDAQSVARGIKHYASLRDTYVFPPAFVHAWVTRENINELLSANDFVGEIDLLSLDLDGVDYWVWEALEVVSPRVVIVEYQDILGPERSMTVPYNNDFRASTEAASSGMPNFAGASLKAFVKLGVRKGYRLVAINRYGYNAFFIKSGIAESQLPTLDIGFCFSHPKVISGMRDRFPLVKECPWVEV
jgi:hypothetical protein